MTQNQNNKVAHVGEHGLKKHDLKVSTVVFMIFCLVAAGCYGDAVRMGASFRTCGF